MLDKHLEKIEKTSTFGASQYFDEQEGGKLQDVKEISGVDTEEGIQSVQFNKFILSSYFLQDTRGGQQHQQ